MDEQSGDQSAGTSGSKLAGMTEKSGNRYDRGSNQSLMRAYNERLLLSLLRRRGAMAKTKIAQLTGLSAQTVSVIMRKLESDGLLQRGKPTRIRGKVGQPSVPMSLVAEGAFFYGLKLGRRSSDLILIDFLGNLVDEIHEAHDYPTPARTVAFTADAIERITGGLSPAQRDRVAGLGVCMPFQLWDWVESIGAPVEILEEWKSVDIRARIATHCDFPVYLQNDATAACGAELVFGQAAAPMDFLYLYIGYFIGGGVVLNGSLFAGKTGNAGAVGSMPVVGADGTTRQLIELASIATLEQSIRAAGGDANSLWDSPRHWKVDSKLLDAWTETAGHGIAQAIGAAAAVIDFETALIDGWLPESVRAAIVSATRRHLADFNARGIELPAVGEGSIGHRARELGAASLPLSLRFLVDQNSPLERD